MKLYIAEVNKDVIIKSENLSMIRGEVSVKKMSKVLKIIFLIFVVIFVLAILSMQLFIPFYLSNETKVGILVIIAFAVVVVMSVIVNKFVDVKEICGEINEKRNELKGEFNWKPLNPITSQKKVRLINEHLKDCKFEIKDFKLELVPNQKAEAIDALSQQIIKFINTQRNKYKIYEGTNYGSEHKLFEVDSSEEFGRQASNLAENIIDYYGEWIEKIYCIKRKGDYLFVEIKVNGKADTLFIEVPNLNKPYEQNQ